MMYEEQLAMLQAMVGTDESSSVFAAYLHLAGRKILNRAYPFRSDICEVPSRYHTLQCEIAAYLMNKRGAEGQVGHSENGISRTYASADVPEAMLSAVTPFVGVISSAEPETE